MVAQVVEQQAYGTAVHAALDALAASGWTRSGDATVRSTMAELARAEARIASLRLAGAQALEQSSAAKRAGATSTGDLLARDFGGDRSAGDRLVRTARAVERTSQVQDALSAGRVSLDQARVIADGLGRLPDGVTDEQRSMAERGLLRDAGRLNLRDLRRRADRAADAFATPTEVDAHENTTLEQREKRARANATLSMWDKRDGTWEGRFRIPEAQAETLKTALDAIAAPRREHLHESDENQSRDPAHRMGLAFTELVGHLPTDQLPAAGGVGATLIVSLDHETLVEGIRPATLSSGTRISAGQARRMACNLGIIPRVLGGQSVTLDLGRTSRLFTTAQKLSWVDRDGGCSFPGCDRPPQWCEGHHVGDPWAKGGTTDQTTGTLICPHHHRVVHAEQWTLRFSPQDGHVEYRRPGDPTWRRNHRWRP